MPEARPSWTIRRAALSDLPAILALEQAAFQPWRQSSPASLRRSLGSPRQSVWVAEAGVLEEATREEASDPSRRAGPGHTASIPSARRGASEGAAASVAAACLVLWHHPHALRVYGVAVRPDLQGHGLGRQLMRHTERLARQEGKRRIILEADASDKPLLAWYEAQGYERVERLPDYYAPRRHAWRLERALG